MVGETIDKGKAYAARLGPQTTGWQVPPRAVKLVALHGRLCLSPLDSAGLEPCLTQALVSSGAKRSSCWGVAKRASAA